MVGEYINIELGADITLSSYWGISQGQIVTLDLNGHTLRRSGLTAPDGDGETNTVPAGTAVMLQVSENTDAQALSIGLTAKEDNRSFASNLLHGSDVATTTTGDGKHYKLSYGQAGSANENVLGWYWGADGGAAFTSGAHKAWLAMPAAASRSFFGLPGEETGMGDATRLNNNEQITKKTTKITTSKL